MTLLPASVGPHQRAALAFEQLEAQLVLELLELLAHAGLRGVQHARGLGDVEIVLGDCDEVAQLYEFHRIVSWWAIEGGEGEIGEGATSSSRSRPRGPVERVRAPAARVPN